MVLKSLDAFPGGFCCFDFASCMWLMRKGQYFRPPALVCLTNFLGYLELVLEKTMPHGTAGGGPLAPEGLSERTQSSGEAEGCGEEPEPLPRKGLVLRADAKWNVPLQVIPPGIKYKINTCPRDFRTCLATSPGSLKKTNGVSVVRRFEDQLGFSWDQALNGGMGWLGLRHRNTWVGCLRPWQGEKRGERGSGSAAGRGQKLRKGRCSLCIQAPLA